MVGPNAFPVVGRWSDARHALPTRTQAFLVETLGPGVSMAVTPSDDPPASRLTAAETAQLAESGAEVRSDAIARQWAAWGMAAVDLLRARAQSLPDAVVWPMDSAAVARIIEWCSARDVVIVPRGGGTSVVGGLAGPADGRRWISMAVSELDAISDINLLDDTVQVGPGVTGPALETELTGVGRVFGHVPQSWHQATIGGYAATRSAGQNSTGYGRIEDLVLAAEMATPIGQWRVGHIPASSIGPNLLRYALGSEGTLGVFTALTLRIRPEPEVRHAEGAMAPDWDSGLAAIRALAQHDLAPSVIRLSDRDETRATWLMSAPTGVMGSLLNGYLRVNGAAEGCLLVMDWHGSRAVVRARRQEAWRLLHAQRVVSLGRRVGRSWVRHRFDGPMLRDELIRQGYFVETFETAAPWSVLPALHARVVSEVTAAAPQTYLMAHVSHVYGSGASLYFTLIAPGDIVSQWPRIKMRLTDAIQDSGGTASHHHGVGIDHAPWLAAELGAVAVPMIRAVKQVVDPNNIMNPMILDSA